VLIGIWNSSSCISIWREVHIYSLECDNHSHEITMIQSSHHAWWISPLPLEPVSSPSRAASSLATPEVPPPTNPKPLPHIAPGRCCHHHRRWLLEICPRGNNEVVIVIS
jgi:hypothetical protein